MVFGSQKSLFFLWFYENLKKNTDHRYVIRKERRSSIFLLVRSYAVFKWDGVSVVPILCRYDSVDHYCNIKTTHCFSVGGGGGGGAVFFPLYGKNSDKEKVLKMLEIHSENHTQKIRLRRAKCKIMFTTR